MLSKSKIQTQKFAIHLAKKILKAYVIPRQARKLLFPERSRRITIISPERNRKATIIALHGDLGAGKTTFVQGFIKALGVKHHITSPTFLIVRRYQLNSKKRQGTSNMFHCAFHLDLYRIHKPRELLDLGFKKIISDPENIVLIEWPERVKKLLPKNTIWIVIEHGRKENERVIEVVSD